MTDPTPTPADILFALSLLPRDATAAELARAVGSTPETVAAILAALRGSGSIAAPPSGRRLRFDGKAPRSPAMGPGPHRWGRK